MRLFGSEEGTKWDAWIGDRIRDARAEKQWTQWDLANAVHKSQTNISDYERGRLQISVVDLLYIALALDKPITFFTPPKFNGMTKDDLRPLDKELFQYVMHMSEESEMALIEQAKSFARAKQKLEEQRQQAARETEFAQIDAQKKKARITRKTKN